MTDVRLTATNPEDSSVVPVACNAKGELKLEEVPTFDGNVDGDLTVSGSATFAGNVLANTVETRSNSSSTSAFTVRDGTTTSDPITVQVVKYGIMHLGGDVPSSPNITLNGQTGSAEFARDVVVGSRNKKWMLVEQGGLCHMVEQITTAGTADLTDLVDPAAEYPPLRDVIAELNAVEQALGEVMELLRMKPPAGWEVWDGSSKNS